MNKMNISFSSVALLYTAAQYRAARFRAGGGGAETCGAVLSSAETFSAGS